jgi:ribose transport system substrate-binding protein
MIIGPTRSRHRKTATVLSIVLAGALAIAGCSSSANGGTKGGTKDTAAADATHSSGGNSALATLYKGTSTSPVTTAPKPAPGKTIWIISSGQALDVAAQATGGAVDAAKAMGWSAEIFDGKYQPNLFLNGVQQAIAAHADGIILYAIDCSYVKTGLQAAKQARIPVVGIESQDCSPSLETPLAYGPAYRDFPGLEKGWGAAAATWLAAKTSSNSTVIELKQTDSQATLLESQGFEAALKAACSGCSIVTVAFTGSDIGPGLQQKAQQALLQHPTSTGLFAPYDALMTSGVAAAVQASGRAAQINVISGGGSVPNLDLVRQGRGQNADLVFVSRWEGFSSVDWLNRLFHGITPNGSNAPTGIGFQLVDKDHNLTKSGPVPSTVDFESIYKKAWGVG